MQLDIFADLPLPAATSVPATHEPSTSPSLAQATRFRPAPVSVDEALLHHLSAARIEGTCVRLVEQLDRKLYLALDKLLQALGGKWSRKDKAHVFDTDAAELIDTFLLTRLIPENRVVDPQKTFGFFQTPPALARQLVRLIDLKPDMHIMEPNAGGGRLIDAVLEITGAPHLLTGVEIQPALVEALRKRYPACTIHEGDFLSVEPTPIFDAAVLNPPFAGSADVRHVLQAMQWLRRGGQLAAILSAGVQFRTGKLYDQLRALQSSGSLLIPNPPESFKAEGTGVQTVMLTLRKA